MDADLSHSDDLNEMERRLAGWSPTQEGLDPDAMLFAAGRASVRGGKSWIAWPIVSGTLALVTAALGTWLAAERSERLALLREIQQRYAEIAPISPPVKMQTSTPEKPAPGGYLVLRREWEQQPGDWLIKPSAQGEMPNRSALPESEILRAWQPHGPHEPL